MSQRSIVFPALALGGALVLALLARSTRSGDEAPTAVNATGETAAARAESERDSLQRADEPPAREALDTPAQMRATPVIAAPPAPATLRLLGRVVGGESGAPLFGAIVACLDATPTSPRIETDVRGLFRWSSRAKREELEVCAEGYAPALVWSDAHGPDAATPVEIRLSRSASLIAHVAGASEALRLRVYTPRGALHDRAAEHSYASDLEVEAPFAADGRARIDGLVPRAPLTLEIRDADGPLRRVPDPLVLEPRETHMLELDLGGARLSVRCVDQRAQPVASVELLLTRAAEAPAQPETARYLTGEDEHATFAHARTDADGRAVFESVPAGVWWIGPTPDGLLDALAPEDAVAPIATAFELTGLERERELVLHLDRGRYLRGRVVDPAGAGVGGGSVGAEHETLGGEVTGDVAADGTFALGPVGAGVHLVRTLSHGTYLVSEPVRAEPDGAEIVIELVRGATLAGRVVVARSGAPTSAEVRCSRPDASLLPNAPVEEDGLFEFRGLPAGTYSIVACTPDGRAGLVQRIEVGAGAALTDVRVELDEAARLVLRRTGGPERVEFALRVAGTLLECGVLDAGVELERFVPAGRVTVTLASTDALLGERTGDARAGERCEVVFELE